MTPEQLQEIKARVEAMASNKFKDEAAFIAHSRQDVPALVAEVERLQYALQEQIEYNRLRNDKDAYLLAVAQWGITGKWGVDDEFMERPQPKDFGLE